MEEAFEASSLPIKGTRSYLAYLRQLHEQYNGGVYVQIGINQRESLALSRDSRLDFTSRVTGD